MILNGSPRERARWFTFHSLNYFSQKLTELIKNYGYKAALHNPHLFGVLLLDPLIKKTRVYNIFYSDCNEFHIGRSLQ